jgi:hypothetical protein
MKRREFTCMMLTIPTFMGLLSRAESLQRGGEK